LKKEEIEKLLSQTNSFQLQKRCKENLQNHSQQRQRDRRKEQPAKTFQSFNICTGHPNAVLANKIISCYLPVFPESL